MLNDRSSLLSLLETRRSGKPREMVGPAPGADELERMLAIAARIPDHGKLSPWRFVTVADHQRDALAKLLRDALAAEDHKIPVWEQQLSCGAAGMNLLLAAHAIGYVAGWITGWQAYSDHVRAAFCEPGERI